MLHLLPIFTASKTIVTRTEENWSSPHILLSSLLWGSLRVGFPVRHFGRNLLARHLARDVSHGLLVAPLGLPERLAMRFGWSGLGERVGKTIARFAGVEESALRWHLTHEEPWFENHISTLKLRGREAVLKVEKPTPEDAGVPHLRTILERRLTQDVASGASRLQARG